MVRTPNIFIASQEPCGWRRFALGICGDFYVVMSMVSESELLPITLTILLLVFFVGLWFALPLLRTSVV